MTVLDSPVSRSTVSPLHKIALQLEIQTLAPNLTKSDFTPLSLLFQEINKLVDRTTTRQTLFSPIRTNTTTCRW